MKLALDRIVQPVNVEPGGEIILRGSFTSAHDGTTIDAATTQWPAGAPGGASVDAGGLIDFEAGGFHMTSRDPKNANMISELAIAVASQRRLEEALALFEQAAELQPTNALFQNNVGTTLFRLGRGAEAIARYEKALAIDPNYADAQKNLMNARKKGS